MLTAGSVYVYCGVSWSHVNQIMLLDCGIGSGLALSSIDTVNIEVCVTLIIHFLHGPHY